MRDFKWDVRELIRCVKERPCLWDKTIENYKDRTERRIAWEEIFLILEPSYEELTPEDKRIMGETILNKWTNVRDTFVKSLKAKAGRPKKRYMLHNELKFLTKARTEHKVQYEEMPYMKQEDIDAYTPEKRSRPNEFDDTQISDTSENEVFTEKREEYDYAMDIPLPSCYSKRKSKKHTEYLDDDKVNTIDFVGIDEENEGRVMNEDEAFFASLLPTVVKYNDDDRLEFRIEVLGIMKKLKEKRRWTDDS